MTTDLNELFIQPNWPAPAGVKAYSSLRHSLVGIPQFASSPNNPKPGNVDRARLKTLLQLPNEPIWLTQTHSTIALKATAANSGKEADASFTDETNQVCAVMTADCLPVLLCNREGTFAAAIHAGWRGLANGIIENTLKAAAIIPEEILVWLGPAIGPDKFEVRQDVVDAFTQHDSEAKTAFRQISEQQWLGDLFTLAKQRLHKQGITQIFGGDYCTHSDPDRFYSYRRDNGLQGRIVSLIWIAP
ncbi:MAG: peptidoglycan editing factor PgeF [Gammaproteobacteria bacterium]|nr:peptidoglycan editing factor PgeF [Gammaproteobacteria bacterium]